MTDLPAAIAAAREALAAYRRNSTRHYIDEALEDVLAALDAARGEAVERGRIDEFGELVPATVHFPALQAPPAALAVKLPAFIRQMADFCWHVATAHRDSSGGASFPSGVIKHARHLAEQWDEYCKAQQPAAADEVAKHSTQDCYEHFLAYSGLEDSPWIKYAYFHGADVGLDRPSKPAPVAPAAAVPAANVTPMRQPRTDLVRLVESIKDAVYANGDGLSVTEAIGAMELAKLELLKEQEQ